MSCVPVCNGSQADSTFGRSVGQAGQKCIEMPIFNGYLPCRSIWQLLPARHHFKLKHPAMEFSTIRALYDITDNSNGFTEAEIAKEEERLQFTLPAVLRQYYLEMGRHEALNHTQDNLVLPEQLEIHAGGYLVIYTENQFVALWGIHTDDIGKADPPVYITYDNKEWKQERGTLSGFLHAMAYLQGIFAFPFNANKAGVTDEEVARVYDGWKPAAQALSIWEVAFFQNDLQEIIAVMKSPDQLDVFVAAKTEARLEDISVQLDIDWDFYSPEDGDDWA